LGYLSRGLTKAERNSSTTEKEHLAIVWAILTLRPYLEGRRFVVRKDHHSLRGVLNFADAQGRLARWRYRLQEFDYEMQYLPGRAHYGADMVSWLHSTHPTLSNPTSLVDTQFPCFFVSHRDDLKLLSVDDPREHQWCDPAYQAVFSHWGGSDSLDMDDRGVLGHVYPSGEFQVIFHDTITTSEPSYAS
jgi:proteasome lid subunit RPN8/RPN11